MGCAPDHNGYNGGLSSGHHVTQQWASARYSYTPVTRAISLFQYTKITMINDIKSKIAMVDYSVYMREITINDFLRYTFLYSTIFWQQ